MEEVRPLSADQIALIDAGLRPEAEAAIKKNLKIQGWIAGEDFRTSLVRLASQPTVNIQGLVSGYTGPGARPQCPIAPRRRSISGWCPTCARTRW
ncbi:hypothetical protein [Arenimonas daejeonensis]|uniref:hypothetical protein n=1 Tax=Arenimonas daejeonensis TaxID=370777 RepID=UPI0011BDF30F|nr:hypothetical protein [Arenimonas daejeonensis]